MNSIFKYVIRCGREDSGEVSYYQIVTVYEDVLSRIYEKYFKDSFNTIETFKKACAYNYDIYKVLKTNNAILNEYYDG